MKNGLLFSSRTQRVLVHPMNNQNNSSNSWSPSRSNKDNVNNEHGLEAFQRTVGERLGALAEDSADGERLLSLAWVREVVDTVLSCEADFKTLVVQPKPPLSKAEERISDDFLERSVKALDLCNAIRDGIDHVRLWQKHVEIVLCALDVRHRSLGEGQLRRARKALADLTLAVDDKEPSAAVLAQYRHRSFGRPVGSSNAACHFRSLSWSVSRSWSAGRQLQAMGSNLVPPKGTEVAASNGFSIPAYTMNAIILFGMWALVAAIPCQDRGLQTHFSFPRTFVWAAPLLSIYDKVMEESRKRDRRSSSVGLLREISQISACIRHLSELVDSPLTENQDQEVRKEVLRLMQVWATVKDGLDPLEKQVRDLFHRIVSTRTEILDSMSRTIPDR